MKKQAIFPVLMLLVVTALALIGSSFAWFSLSNTATVGEISANTEAASAGLMVSTNAENFYSTVTPSSTNETTYIMPTELTQVSTGNLKDFFACSIITKNVDGTAAKVTSAAYGTALSATNTAVTTGKGYIAFDLYFQVDNDSYLYVNKGTTFVSDASSAIRIAFVDMGSAAGKTNVTDLNAYGTIAGTGAKVWAPGTGSDETTYGVSMASLNLWKETATAGVYAESTEKLSFTPYVDLTASNGLNGAGDASGTSTTLNSVVEYSALCDSNLMLTTENTVASGEKTTKNIATLEQVGTTSVINKIRILVWFEGNDSNCISTMASKLLKLNLKFYAIPQA